MNLLPLLHTAKAHRIIDYNDYGEPNRAEDKEFKCRYEQVTRTAWNANTGMQIVGDGVMFVDASLEMSPEWVIEYGDKKHSIISIDAPIDFMGDAIQKELILKSGEMVR